MARKKSVIVKQLRWKPLEFASITPITRKNPSSNSGAPFVATTGLTLRQLAVADFLLTAARGAEIQDSAWASSWSLHSDQVSDVQLSQLARLVEHKGMVPLRDGEIISFAQQAWLRRNPRSTGYVAAKIRANTARRNSGSLPRNKIYAPPNVVRQGDIRSDLIHDDRRAAIAAAQVLLVRMRSAWLWYDDLDIELEDGYLTTSQVPSMEKRLVEADLKRYFPDLTDFDLKRVLSQVKGWGSVQPRDKMDKLARAAVKIRD